MNSYALFWFLNKIQTSFSFPFISRTVLAFVAATVFFVPNGLLLQANAQVPRDGLVAEYLFDGNINDTSGNNNNGYANGTNFVPNKATQEASAINFNGRTDYVEIPYSHSLSLTGRASFSFWVKFNQMDRTENGYDWQTIFAKTPYWENYGFLVKSDICSDYWSCYDYGHKSRLWWNGAFMWDQNTTYDWNNVEANKWYHIVVLYDGMSVRYFFNGTIVLYAKQYGPLIDSDNPLVFGMSRAYWWPYPLDGQLDNFRIYNRALTEDEIKVLYTENAPFRLLTWSPTGKINGAVNPKDTISLYFNTAIQSITVPNNISLVKNGVQTVPARTMLTSDAKQILVSPLYGAFEAWTSYNIVIWAGLRSQKNEAVDTTSIYFFVQDSSFWGIFSNFLPNSSDAQIEGNMRLIWNKNNRLVSSRASTKNTINEGDPVVLSTGEFTYENTLLSLPGGSVPHEFSIKYASKAVYQSPLGHKFTYSPQIYLSLQPDDSLYLVDNSLSSIKLGILTGDSLYIPILKATLTKDTNGNYCITYDSGKIYHFNSNKRISFIDDGFGNTLTYTYNENRLPMEDGRLIKTTDSLGGTMDYTYTTNGQLDWVTSSLWQHIQMEYYASTDTGWLVGDLKTIVLHYGDSEKKIAFTYDTGATHEHDIVSLTDAKWQLYVVNSYDTNNRISSQLYGTGTLTYDYTLGDLHIDDVGSVVGTGDVIGNFVQKNEVHDKKGNKTVYEYNRLGNMLSQEAFTSTGASLGKNIYTYDANSRMISEMFPNGNGKTWKYDNDGNKIEEREKADMSQVDNDAVDIVNRWEYSTGSALPIAYIDSLGSRTEFTYGFHGEILSEVVKTYHTANNSITQNHTTTYLYDSLGRKQEIHSPNRATVYYNYNGTSANISSIQYGTGQEARVGSFTYDSFGNIATRTNELNQTSTYLYDSWNHLTQSTSPLGVVSQKTYDANNNLLSDKKISDGKSVGLSYAYNILDQVEGAIQDVGENTVATTGILYDANGSIAAKTYENGSKTAYVYDEFDRVVSTTQYGSGYTSGATSTGITTTYTYDANGNIAAKTNPNGFVVKYEYDGFSRPIKIHDSPTSYLQLSYDKKGNVLDEKRYASTSGALLYWKQTSYNELGQVLQQSAHYINADGSVDNSKAIIVSYVYDNSGKVISVDKNGKIVLSNIYNEFGETISTKDALGNETRFTYNKNGQKTQEETLNSSGVVQNTITYTYNADGQLTATTQVSANASRTISKEYNSLGQVIATTDAKGQKTSYTYDFLGNPLTTQYPNGTSNRNEYDAMRRLIATIDEKGNKTTYEYDIFGRLAKKILPDNTADIYEYDQEGKIVKSTDANSTIKTYTYDTIGRLTDTIVTQAGSGVVSAPNTHREYDALGHLISITSSDGSQPLAFSYDGLGQLIQESQNGKIVAYTYSSGGLLDSLIYPSGRVITHHYDAADKLTAITNNTNQEILAKVYNGSFLQAKTTNGIEQQQTHDGFGRNTQISASTFFTENYAYDANDNLTGNNSTTYAYDTRDQLTQESESGSLLNNYTYDSAGNIESYTNKANQTKVYTANTLNQYTSDSQSGSYAYDQNGNLIEDNKHTYTYDTNNQLVEVWQKAYTSTETTTQSGATQDCTTSSGVVENTSSGVTESGSGAVLDNSGTTQSGSTQTTACTPQTTTTEVTHLAQILAKYHYDPLGRRYEKILSDNTKITYIYSNQDILEETTTLNENTIDTKEYIYGQGEMDDLEAIVQNNQIYTTIKDRQGSIRKVIDTNGNTIQSIDYDAYGNILSETGSNLITNRLYTGREYDKETNLYYLRARYYNPQDHRFLSRDPLGNVDSLNQYLYTKNNPLKWTDRSGMKAKGVLETNQPVAIIPEINLPNIVRSIWGSMFAGWTALAAISAPECAASVSATTTCVWITGTFALASWGSWTPSITLCIPSGITAGASCGTTAVGVAVAQAGASLMSGEGGGSNKKFETKESLNKTDFTWNDVPSGNVNPLSKSYVEILKKRGFNAEAEKANLGKSKADIFKDSEWNMFVAPKKWKKSDWLDSLTPIMKNIKDFLN